MIENVPENINPLSSEIDELLDTLAVSKDRFLSRKADSDPPDLTRYRIPRATYYDCLAEPKKFNADIARRLRFRLQFFLDAAFRDRDALQPLIERRKTVNSDRDLFDILVLAIAEETASPNEIDRREDRADSLLAKWRKRRSADLARRKSKTFDFTEILEFIDELIDLRSAKGSGSELARKLHTLRLRSRILGFKKGRFLVVDSDTFFDKFDSAASAEDVTPGFPQLRPEASVVMPVSFANDPELVDSDRFKRFLEAVKDLEADGYQIQFRNITKLENACTTVYIETSARSAEALREAFLAGMLADSGVISIDESLPQVSSNSSTNDDSGVDQSRLLEAFARARKKESFIRPWRRLKYLFHPRVVDSPLAHTLRKSDQRAYAAPNVPARWIMLRSDLKSTLLLWPLFGILIAAVLLLPLPQAVVVLAILSAFSLSTLGSQPCSSLISPLACGAGTIVMGVGFSVAHAVSLGMWDSLVLADSVLRKDVFVSIAGGIVGLSAPTWRAQLGLPLSIVLGGCVALSIAVTAWLMAQPGRASRRPSPRRGRVIAGAFIGAGTGIGIGLIAGLNAYLKVVVGEQLGFIISFATIASLWVLGSTRLRTGSWYRGALVSAAHTVVGVALITATFALSGHAAGLVALSASQGFFQSIFFTSAFVVGEWWGGHRAAFWAAVIEGSIGFSIFLATRML